MSFLGSFFSKSYLGVDIGTTTIKVVELGAGAQKPKLKNYGHLEAREHLDRLGGAIQTSSLEIENKGTTELLTVLLRKMKPSTKAAVASVPTFSGFTTLLELPEMTDKELAQAIQFQAREHIPLPLEEVIFDWTVVHKRQEGGVARQDVLLSAIPLSVVRAYQSIFENAGLSLNYIELDSVAAVRAAIGNDPTPTVLVDIGSRATVISVADGGSLRLTFNAETSGNDLTLSIAKSLKVGTRRAEELKRTRGLVTRAADEELSALLMPLLDAIISEVTRAISIYKEKHGVVERVMLTGGTANMPHIVEYVGDQLKLPVVVAAPLHRLEYSSSIEPLAKELGPVFTPAIGLALKNFS